MTSAQHVGAGTPPAKARGDQAKTFLQAALPLLVIYLVTAAYVPAQQSNDARAVVAAATVLADTGSLTMDSLAGEDLWLFFNGERWLTNRFPGAIFATVPFAWLTGATPGTYWVGGIAAASITATAMGFLAVVLRGLGPRREAVVATWLFGLATSTWAISAGAMWTHGPAQLCLALSMAAAAHGSQTRAGLWAGAAAFARPQLGVVSAVYGVAAGLAGRRWDVPVRVAAGTAVGVAAFLAYVTVVLQPGPPAADELPPSATSMELVTTEATDVGLLSGGYGPGPLRSLVETSPSVWSYRALSSLFSPNRGVLVQSPWLLLGVAGALAVRRRAPIYARAMALAGVASLLVQLRLNVFSGGSRLVVYRLPIEALTLTAPLLFLGYRDWVSRSVHRLRAFWILASFSACLQVFAIVGRGAPTIPNHASRQDDWTLGEYGQALSRLDTAQVAALAVVAGAMTIIAFRAAPTLRVGPAEEPSTASTDQD